MNLSKTSSYLAAAGAVAAVALFLLRRRRPAPALQPLDPDRDTSPRDVPAA